LATLESSPDYAEALRNLCRKRVFQRSVRSFALDKMKGMTEKDLVKAFKAADTDKSGSLELDEVTALIRSIDPSFPLEEIKELLRYVDVNESGSIDLDEFKRIFKDFEEVS